MTPARKQRLAIVVLIVLGVGATVALALNAFNKNMQLFFTPTEIAEGKAPAGQTIRAGGLVMAESVVRSDNSLLVKFTLTDTANTIPVEYTGILPDLFREGQGIVALGKMNAENTFVASEVLAKHDENYMPPEVAEALEKAGATHPESIPRNTDKN